jgi:hypothetical protein
MLVLAPTRSAAQADTSDNSESNVVRYETEGSLESKHDLGCIAAAEMANVYTPTDLYRAISHCGESGRFEDAALLFLVANAYGRFDMLRVADESAGRAIPDGQARYMGKLDQEITDALQESINALLEGEVVSAAVCDAVKRVGPPDYHPTYMIQHGLNASVPWAGEEGAGEDGLWLDFDAAAAWDFVVREYMKCAESAAGVAAPGPSEEEIEEAHDRLVKQGSELDALRAELTAAESQARAEELAAQNEQLSALFMANMVDFLNSTLTGNADSLTEQQKDVIRRKSYEDMLIARDFVEKGGDYATAIAILEDARALDPGYVDLEQYLEWVRANRYMSAERFAAVEVGMTDYDVRGALGQVNLYNVKTYEDRGVTAWFYPTAEGGKAAAIWFKPGPDGQLVVYSARFDAVTGDSGAE